MKGCETICKCDGSKTHHINPPHIVDYRYPFLYCHHLLLSNQTIITPHAYYSTHYHSCPTIFHTYHHHHHHYHHHHHHHNILHYLLEPRTGLQADLLVVHHAGSQQIDDLQQDDPIHDLCEEVVHIDVCERKDDE